MVELISSSVNELVIFITPSTQQNIFCIPLMGVIYIGRLQVYTFLHSEVYSSHVLELQVSYYASRIPMMLLNQLYIYSQHNC